MQTHDASPVILATFVDPVWDYSVHGEIFGIQYVAVDPSSTLSPEHRAVVDMGVIGLILDHRFTWPSEALEEINDMFNTPDTISELATMFAQGCPPDECVVVALVPHQPGFDDPEDDHDDDSLADHPYKLFIDFPQDYISSSTFDLG